MLKNLRTILITAIIFFSVTLPFRAFFSVMEVTEMRPAAALPPVFGLMLGIPGALGCALGNLAADILSGYSPLLNGLGLVIQFIYGAIPYMAWKLIQKRTANEALVFRLNHVKNVIRYIAIILINAAILTALLGAVMQGFGFSPFFSSATLMIFFNNAVFCMVLGLPIVIFMSVKMFKSGTSRLSLNERLVLMLLLFSVISAGMIGVFAYAELSRVMAEPLAMWNRVYSYVTASLFISLLITVAVLRYAEKNVTVPIESLAGIVKDYISGADGKKDGALVAAECEEYTKNRNETGVLAGAFQTMALDLDIYIDNLTRVTAEKERIGAELDVAAKIQASMLPCIFPAFPNRDEFDIYASMQPAKEVGGDFYDFFLIDENTLAVVMADVSGKGVPAALFMVIAKTLLKNNAQYGKSPKEVFEAVNNILCENNDADMFVTAFMGYLDIPSGKFTYVNAGHNPPLIRRAGEKYDWLPAKPGFVLAGMEDMVYKQHEVTLNPGDELFLYTDGVTEAVNQENELFSDPRLLETLNRCLDLPLRELSVSVKCEIDDFADGAEQADDITMLALRTGGTV